MTRISPSPPISFCYLFLHSYTGELEAVARALLSQPSARCVLTKGDPSQTLTSSQARSAMMDLLSLSLLFLFARRPFGNCWYCSSAHVAAAAAASARSPHDIESIESMNLLFSFLSLILRRPLSFGGSYLLARIAQNSPYRRRRRVGGTRKRCIAVDHRHSWRNIPRRRSYQIFNRTTTTKKMPFFDCIKRRSRAIQIRRNCCW